MYSIIIWLIVLGVLMSKALLILNEGRLGKISFIFNINLSSMIIIHMNNFFI
jgi:hypothetical protein